MAAILFSSDYKSSSGQFDSLYLTPCNMHLTSCNMQIAMLLQCKVNERDFRYIISRKILHGYSSGYRMSSSNMVTCIAVDFNICFFFIIIIII